MSEIDWWDLSVKIDSLKKFGEIGETLADILTYLTRILSNISNRLNSLEFTIKKMEGNIDQLMKSHEDIADILSKLSEDIAELRQRSSRMELTMGAITESYLSWRFLEKLERENMEIKHIERNLIINNEEIDLVVDTTDKVYIVEIKVKPRISDIGALLAKTELYTSKTRTSKEVIPVIIGVYIGRDLENYARKKNVKIYKF